MRRCSWRSLPGFEGEGAGAEPAGELSSQVSLAGDAQAVGPFGLDEGDITHPNGRHDVEGRLEEEVFVVAGVVEAEVGCPGLGDEPPVLLAGGGIGKAEVNDNALNGKSRSIDLTADVPHQQAGVEVVVAQAAANPTGAPAGHVLNERLELGSGRRQFVAHPGFVADVPNNAVRLELFEPAREEGWRHEGDASAEVVEVAAARRQLADDDERPALTEDLGGLRHWAELTVRSHAQRVRRPGQRSSTHRVLAPHQAAWKGGGSGHRRCARHEEVRP